MSVHPVHQVTSQVQYRDKTRLEQLDQGHHNDDEPNQLDRERGREREMEGEREEGRERERKREEGREGGREMEGGRNCEYYYDSTFITILARVSLLQVSTSW